MNKQSRWSESWSEYSPPTDSGDVIVRDVRLQSNAGWYVGAVEFYNFDEMDFYSCDSGYYPSEEMLKEEYPNTISVEEAFSKLKLDRFLNSKMKRKLAS